MAHYNSTVSLYNKPYMQPTQKITTSDNEPAISTLEAKVGLANR